MRQIKNPWLVISATMPAITMSVGHLIKGEADPLLYIVMLGLIGIDMFVIFGEAHEAYRKKEITRARAESKAKEIKFFETNYIQDKEDVF